MIDHVLRDLQALQKADVLIARVWLNALARRLGFFVFGALIALFGLGMANLAAFFALQQSLGSEWAAGIVAAADLLVAAVIMLVGGRSRPGPEVDIAFDVRRMALESLQEDARGLKSELDALGRDLRAARANIGAMVHDPLDAATRKLLVPAVLAIVRRLRTGKEDAAPAP